MKPWLKKIYPFFVLALLAFMFIMIHLFAE